MSGKRSPFGPKGIAGGPLTEVKKVTDELRDALELAKLRRAVKDVDARDARAFVGEL